MIGILEEISNGSRCRLQKRFTLISDLTPVCKIVDGPKKKRVSVARDVLLFLDPLSILRPIR